MNTFEKNKLYVLIGSVVGIIATFIPWIVADFFGQTMARSGFEGDGKIVAVLFAIIVTLTLLGDRGTELSKERRLISFILAAINLLIVFVTLINIYNVEFVNIAKPGFGIFLTIVSTAAVMTFAAKGSVSIFSKKAIEETVSSVKEAGDAASRAVGAAVGELKKEEPAKEVSSDTPEISAVVNDVQDENSEDA